jgi:hypothetical protein
VITVTPERADGSLPTSTRNRPKVRGLRSPNRALTQHLPIWVGESEYVARIPHLFIDPTEHDHILDLYLIDLPEPDHPVPTVNVVEIRQIGEDSLSTISKEGTGSIESHGTSYTHTLIDSYG